MLAVFPVNSMLDNGDGANTTLREALDFAEQSEDPQDVIKFDETVFANGGTIELTGGDLLILESNELLIDGRSSAGVPLGITIDRGHGPDDMSGTFDGFSVLFINSSGHVEIDSLKLTGGDAFSGGGIHSYRGDLTVRNSIITGNSSQGAGGGIHFSYNGAYELNIISSTISENSSNFRGGGISVFGLNGTVSIQSSVITGNQSRAAGGVEHSDPLRGWMLALAA